LISQFGRTAACRNRAKRRALAVLLPAREYSGPLASDGVSREACFSRWFQKAASRFIHQTDFSE
jgi:hypothetical protein